MLALSAIKAVEQPRPGARRGHSAGSDSDTSHFPPLRLLFVRLAKAVFPGRVMQEHAKRTEKRKAPPTAKAKSSVDGFPQRSIALGFFFFLKHITFLNCLEPKWMNKALQIL